MLTSHLFILLWMAFLLFVFKYRLRLKSYILCFVFKGISLFLTMRGSYGPVKPLPFGFVLKLGKLNAAEEAQTIFFIQKNTQIPVPHIIVSASGLWNHYMLMKHIDGELLEFTWNHLSEEGRSRVVKQLRSIVKQLRSLSVPPVPMVSALNNAPCLDARVAGNKTFGPFSTVAEFNDHLINVSQPYMDEPDLRRIRSQLVDKRRIVFTHGDLAPRNIFMNGDNIVALIDWEHAGWYPEHWEFVKAKYCHMLDESWDDAIAEIIPQDYLTDWILDKRLSDAIVGPI